MEVGQLVRRRHKGYGLEHLRRHGVLYIHCQEHAPILTRLASVGVEVVAADVQLCKIAGDLRERSRRSGMHRIDATESGVVPVFLETSL